MTRFVTTLSCLLIFPLTLHAAEPPATKPLDRYREATVIETVVRELSKRPLSSDFKQSVLKSARSEDRDLIALALAKYRASDDLRLYNEFGRMTGYDKNEAMVLSVEPIPGDSKRFIINGTEWSMPEKGSVYRAIEKIVSPRASGKKSARAEAFQALVPAATAAADESALVTPVYVFVHQRRGTDGGGTEGRIVSEEAQKQNTHEHLRYNDTQPISRALNFFKLGFPVEVLCRGDVALGKAKVGGTSVSFEARGNLDLVLRTEGSGRGKGVLVRPNFGHDPDNAFAGAKAQATLTALEMVPTWPNPTSASEGKSLEIQREGLYALVRAIDHACRNVPASGAATRPGDACGEVSSFYREKQTVVQQLKHTTVKDRAAVEAKYITEALDVLRFHNGNLQKWLAYAVRIKRVYPESQTLSACEDTACMTRVPESDRVDDVFRLPPNKIEDSVVEAETFAKTNRGAIVFACATKDYTCQRMKTEPAAYDKLSPEKRKQADALVKRANEALKWKLSDPGLQAALGSLRYLGQCCENLACRAALKEQDIKFVPPIGNEVGATKQ